MPRLLLLFLLAALALSCERPAPSKPAAPARPRTTWKVFTPENPKPPDPNKKVRCTLLTLLQPERETAAATSAKSISDFLADAEARMTQAIGAPTSTFNLRLSFSCKPGAFTLDIAYAGDVKPELLQKIHDAVTAAAPLKTTGDVGFISDYDVHP